MVPEVDKQDTYIQLDQMRAEIETTRQQILTLELDAVTGEKEALKKLAMRSFQQARQWTGRMLGELGISHPYPNSSDATTQIIDPTTVRTDANRPDITGMTPVQQIKAARTHVSELNAKLKVLLTQVTPGSAFNQFLFQTQNHLLQAGMWLGELLAEHFDEQPVVEAPASGNESASSSEAQPTSLTPPTLSETTTGSVPSNESTLPFETQAPNLHEVEGASEVLSPEPAAEAEHPAAETSNESERKL